MRLFLIAIPPLVLVYALTLASFHPWDLAIGVVLAAGTLLLFRRFLTDPARQIRGDDGKRRSPNLFERFIWFWPYAIAVIGTIIHGTWIVALTVLHLRPIQSPGIVRVPIGERTQIGVAVTSLAETLSPGSVLVDIDWDDEMMFFHVLDASDPDAYRGKLQAFYERWQRHVAP
jgi:multisubunit Na+/H+ antiporter MnhE subunit